MATAAGFDQRHGYVTLAGENRAVDARQREIGALWPLVKALQRTVPCVVNDGFPLPFRLADDDRIGIQRRFIRTQRCVKTAHDNGNAAPPIFRCNLVGAVGRVSFDRNADEIRRFVEGNGFETIVVERDVHVGGCQPGQ